MPIPVGIMLAGLGVSAAGGGGTLGLGFHKSTKENNTARIQSRHQMETAMYTSDNDAKVSMYESDNLVEAANVTGMWQAMTAKYYANAWGNYNII